MKKPFVIGISGSIGSGKSLVRYLLGMRGVFTIDADELTHFLLMKGKAGHAAAVELFGKDILDKNGEVDRGRLGQIVFKDPLALKKLEERMHPLVNESVQSILKNTNCPVVAVEAIKLYDSDLIHAVDSRWFVTSTTDSQVERLKKSRGMSQVEITDRLRAQYFPKEMEIDFFIENSGQIRDTWEQIAFIWQEMSQIVPEFNIALAQMPEDLIVSIADLPAVEGIDPKELQRILKILGNERKGSHKESILQAHAFLQPLEQENTHLIWKFDHFNIRIEGISQRNEKAFFMGLKKLEKITQFWRGNCLLVRGVEEDNVMEQELLRMGYQILSLSEIERFPYLAFEPFDKDKPAIWYIKPMLEGIWRFIP